MGFFSNQTTEGHEERKDVLGGGSFGAVESGAYKATLKAMYVQKSASSASIGIVVVATLEGGREYNETLWVIGKDGNNFSRPKDKNGKVIESAKPKTLSGYEVADDLCMFATGKPLNQQDEAEKVMEIWNSEAKAKQPTKVTAFPDVVGGEVILLIKKSIEDKTQFVEGRGYVPTGDTVERNSISKVIHDTEKQTVKEIVDNSEGSVFYDEWIKAHEGKTSNRSKGAPTGGAQAGRPTPPKAGGGAPQAAATVTKPGMFGKRG